MRAFLPTSRHLTSRRARLAAIAAPVLFVAGLTAAVAALVTPATAATTTTVAAATTTAPTTTIAPTTTVPATTTTVAPTTTSSSSSTSTTSSSTTTTTIAPKPASSSSSTPWGWIIAVLAVIAVLAFVAAVLLRRSQKKGAVSQWSNVAVPARDDANIARDMLLGASVERGAPTPQDVTVKADAAALELDRAASEAPDDERRDAAAAAAAALRGLQFALESEAILRGGATPPTADQLAQADVTHRTRARDLDQALARFNELVPPPETTIPPPAPR